MFNSREYEFADLTVFMGNRDISGLPRHQLDEFSHFFEVYKTLEGKKTVVEGFEGRKAAEQAIERAMEAYKRHFA